MSGWLKYILLLNMSKNLMGADWQKCLSYLVLWLMA